MLFDTFVNEGKEKINDKIQLDIDNKIQADIVSEKFEMRETEADEQIKEMQQN